MKRKAVMLLGLLALFGMYVVVSLMDADTIHFGRGAVLAASCGLAGALCLWKAGVVQWRG